MGPSRKHPVRVASTSNEFHSTHISTHVQQRIEMMPSQTLFANHVKLEFWSDASAVLSIEKGPKTLETLCKFNQESKSSSGFGRRIAMVPFSSEKHQQARFHPPISGQVDFVECVKQRQHGKKHPAVDHARSGQQERGICLRLWRVVHHSLQLCVKNQQEENHKTRQEKAGDDRTRSIPSSGVTDGLQGRNTRQNKVPLQTIGAPHR
jgi:hypothetical protein